MNLFLSKYINNIDKKGRVSVPASYRQILAVQNSRELIIYPSIKHSCLEVCSVENFIKLNKMIEALDCYSDARDALETVLLGESIQLAFDSEGRITIPKDMMEYAEIDNQVCFVGKGSVFEMWDYGNFQDYLTKAKEVARSNKQLLRVRQED